MAERVKVPSLNLSKNIVPAETSLSKLDAVQTTEAETVSFIPGSSFYTQRGATEEYIIPGLRDSDKKTKVNLNEENLELN